MLDLSQGITYNEPNKEPSGCIINDNGINVIVIKVFISEHPFLGSVSHNNNSENCMIHHPIRVNANHLK
jgi:hypothetical protein